MRRAARITGTLMIVAGTLSIGWALLVWQWQDPFTAIYTKYEQHKLASSFAHRFADYRACDGNPKRANPGPGHPSPPRRPGSRRTRPHTGRRCARASRSGG